MSGPSARFRVGIAGAQRDRLLRWTARATAAGRADELLAAIDRVNYRLEFEADTWGVHYDYLDALHVRLRRGQE